MNGSPPAHDATKQRPSSDNDKSRLSDAPDLLTNSRNGKHQTNHEEEDEASTPSTPKRARIAPLEIPRGIKPSDFHDLHIPTDREKRKPGTQVETERDGEKWSIEDDHMLVEVVLAKLDLSDSDWEQCARSLGRDEDCAERRWKSLMENRAVGLKSSKTRRGKNCKTW